MNLQARIPLLISSLALLLSTSTGFCAKPAQDKLFALEEVVVTARKREENLQDTPISVAAFTSKELEIRQIESTDKLGDVTPNLTFDSAAPSSGSSSAAQIFIRGIGQTDFVPVTDPGVGVYVDGVYMSRSIGNVMDFLDVERVEILRGPQGTLFGRNTIGGAVSLHSKRPTDEFGGSLKAQFGDDNMVYVTARVNGALTQNLTGNLAYAYRERDGYVERINDGTDTGDDDSNALRGSLFWTPADSFAAFITADYTKIRENGAPLVAGGVNDLQAIPTFANGVLTSCSVVSINPNFPIAGPPSFPPPGASTNGAPGCANETSVLGKHTSGGTFPVTSELDVWGVSLELTWDVADWLSIKSISAYREVEMLTMRDADNTPGNILGTMDDYEHEQVSQELQFSGRAFDEKLQWLLGLYYFQEEGFDIAPVYIPMGAFVNGGFYDNDSKAVFFQSTYDVTDRLSLTFGIRYTEDAKRFKPEAYIIGDASMGPINIFPNTWPLLAGMYLGSNFVLPAGARLLPAQEFEENFYDDSIMINLAYNWSDELMTYVTYSQGFKSGGFDLRFIAPEPAPSTFEPEYVDSYEIGFKSQWLNNSLRVNGAIFYTDYDDLQIIIRESFNPQTFNGGEADIFGAELELTWVPTDRWYITAAVGYIDAEYDKLSDEVLTNATPILPDNELVNTPEWSASIGMAYTVDLQDWATLTPRVDWSFHDKQYNDAINTPQLIQDQYDLINVAVALETNDGRWEGVLAFRNVLDEEYLVTGNSSFSTTAGYLEQVYDRGAEWSISVKYNFF